MLLRVTNKWPCQSEFVGQAAQHMRDAIRAVVEQQVAELLKLPEAVDEDLLESRECLEGGEEGATGSGSGALLQRNLSAAEVREIRLKALVQESADPLESMVQCIVAEDSKICASNRPSEVAFEESSNNALMRSGVSTQITASSYQSSIISSFKGKLPNCKLVRSIVRHLQRQGGEAIKVLYEVHHTELLNRIELDDRDQLLRLIN